MADPTSPAHAPPPPIVIEVRVDGADEAITALEAALAVAVRLREELERVAKLRAGTPT